MRKASLLMLALSILGIFVAVAVLTERLWAGGIASALVNLYYLYHLRMQRKHRFE